MQQKVPISGPLGYRDAEAASEPPSVYLEAVQKSVASPAAKPPKKI